MNELNLKMDEKNSKINKEMIHFMSLKYSFFFCILSDNKLQQLGMMVIAIGLSSYNIALFHLVNHAFYKALLFLGAGAVIHSVADNQDQKKKIFFKV